MALRIVEEHGLTDVGRQRHRNEDAFFESADTFAVADGMGGARAGEVASRIAVEAFEAQRDESSSPEAQLTAIARAANRKIYELAQGDESRAGMGTTLSAVMVSDHDIAVGHVGDSRVYRWRDDQLERLTHDHSLVEELVRQGKLSPQDAENHPQKSVITRALGPEPDVEVETFTCPSRDEDVYLICSDGLTTMVPEERVAEVIRGRSSLRQAAEELVRTANESGGRDNITVVLFRLGSEAASDDEHDTLSGQETSVGADTGVLAPVEEGEGPERTSSAPANREGTLLLDPETAERARSDDARRPAEAAEGDAVRAKSARAAARRRRGRTALKLAVALLCTAALVAGLYAGGRQVYFIGTNDAGLITLYRGLPYELSLGVRLYGEEYGSAVPAASLPRLQRERILDHELRERRDAVGLIRQLESGRTAGL